MVIRSACDEIRASECSTSGGSSARVAQLGVAADRGERGAQLVAGVGDELAQLHLAVLAGLEGRAHVVRASGSVRCPTCPTSVRGSASGTRSTSETSPRSSGSALTLAAVAATRSSGRSSRRTTTAPATPATSRVTPATISSVVTSRATVSCTGRSGSPVTDDDPRRQRRWPGGGSWPSSPRSALVGCPLVAAAATSSGNSSSGTDCTPPVPREHRRAHDGAAVEQDGEAVGRARSDAGGPRREQAIARVDAVRADQLVRARAVADEHPARHAQVVVEPADQESAQRERGRPPRSPRTPRASSSSVVATSRVRSDRALTCSAGLST